jgi:hypothetical protein
MLSENVVTYLQCLLKDCDPASLVKNNSFLAEQALAFNPPGSNPKLVEKTAKYGHYSFSAHPLNTGTGTQFRIHFQPIFSHLEVI